MTNKTPVEWFDVSVYNMIRAELWSKVYATVISGDSGVIISGDSGVTWSELREDAVSIANKALDDFDKHFKYKGPL